MSLTLAGGLGALVVTLSLVALWTLNRLAADADQYEGRSRDALDELLLAERLHNGLEETVAISRGYLLSSDPQLLTRLHGTQRLVDTTLDQLAARSGAADDRSAVDEIRRTGNDYRAMVTAAIDRKRAGASHEEVLALFDKDLRPARRRLDDAIEAFVTAREERLAQHRQHVQQRRRQAQRTALATLAAGTLASVFLAALLGHHLAALYRREHQALRHAERESAAREEMLAVVAHDLRSPLSAINLRAGMLRARGPDDRTRAQAEAISELVAGTEALLKSMLDLTRIDAGRFTVDVVPFDARQLLRHILEIFNDLAAVRSVRLECNLPSLPEISLRADRERLVQVLSNLVGNAIKFAPPGSAVVLEAETAGQELHFRVADEGPGIAPADQPLIFERFWKGPTPNPKGAGLGLYIARSIVEAHGGRIWVNSDAGRGTTFHFTIPCAGPAAGEDPPLLRIREEQPDVAGGAAAIRP